MKKILIIGLMTLLFSGCAKTNIIHDENKAMLEANKVFKTVYINKNYNGAFDKGDLKRLVDTMIAKVGELKEAQLDSFLPSATKREMALFYNGVNEKGPSYHRVFLVGDINGYKVKRLCHSEVPYPEHKLRQKFNKVIVVK